MAPDIVLARDSLGRVVGTFPPQGAHPEVGKVLNWHAHGRTTIVLAHPGRLILASRLGSRTDTLMIEVR